MKNWTLHTNCPEARIVFQTLETVFKLNGEQITCDRLSDLIFLNVGGKNYYVKRYTLAGKGIRRFLGRSRLRGEWENLLRFNTWGLPTAKLIAYGAEKHGPFFTRGALITEELPRTQDLAELAKENDPRLRDSNWIGSISEQLAKATRKMHENRFAHGDLKWRNILVAKGPNPQIHLIDCPDGRHWTWPFLQYRKNKDLACLDKVAKKVLTRTQRLRFFLDYLEQDHLSSASQKQLRHIIRFFDGRE